MLSDLKISIRKLDYIYSQINYLYCQFEKKKNIQISHKPDMSQIFSRYFLDIFWIFSGYILDIFWIFSRYFLDILQMYFLDIFQMFSGYFLDIFQIFSGSFRSEQKENETVRILQIEFGLLRILRNRIPRRQRT